MLTVNRILCPTDLSDPSFHALDKAIELARHFGAELLLLHVVPDVPPLPNSGAGAFPVVEYERALEESARGRMTKLVAEKVPPDVKVRWIVTRGDAATQILLASEDEKVDLVVIATHGMTGWRHLIFGSVTEKVVRLEHRPVLTLRRPPQ